MQSIKDILGQTASSIKGGVLEMLEKSSASWEEKKKKYEGQTSLIDLLKMGGGIAKTIGQATAQSGGSVGLTLMGKGELTSEELPEGQRKIKDIIFGTEPVKSIQTRVAESELKQQKEGISILGKQIAKPEQIKGFETPLAMFGVGATIALDFTGAGGEKNVVKVLAATKDAGKVAKILRGINVAEDLVPEYSKIIAKMDKVEDVTKALGKVKEIQAGTKTVARIAPEAQKEVSGALKAEKGIIPQIKTIKEVVGAKERGFISSVKAELPELKVAGQYIPRDTDKLAIKARNLVKTDLPTAEQMARVGTDDKAVATGAELLKHYSDEAAKATDEAVKDALYTKAADLANDMAHKLTEQGRSVQAASILGRITPEGQLKFAAREIQKYNEEIEAAKGGFLGLRKKIPELMAEQGKQIVGEMKAIQEMADGTEKAVRFQKLQNTITDLVPTPLFKKMVMVWKAGLLTGLKTTGVNIFSNVSHFGTEVAKDIPATIVDQVTSLFTGKRAVTFNLQGVAEGAKEGVGKGIRYFRTGFDERNIGTKLDYRRINFGKGKLAQGLQAYTDTVFRALGTEDQPFYYATKLRSMYEQAKVKAINEGLKGVEAQKFIDDLISNPTEDMIRYASHDAEVAVFQNKTALGSAARAIQKIGGGAGEIVVPFGRTPSAVAMQIVNYSPIGIVKTIFENVGKGKFDQRLFSQGIGRGLTGTAVLALGSMMYKKGMINLARPTGETEQKLWEQERRTANSFYDPIGKKWRSVQVLGPVGNLLVIGGHFQKEFSEEGSPTAAMAKAMAGASQSFSQQTFLTGVSNFIDAVSDPARSAKSVAGSTLASTVPTIVSDIARATDTKERRANEILEKFQARIPGLRERLEPQVTVLGEEKETVGNPLEIMADPTRPSPAKSSPVTDEMRRLWDEGYHVSPTLLGDKEGYDSLTAKENTELWKRAGEIISSKVGNLIKVEEYQGLPDDKKAKKIEQFVSKAKLMARAEAVLAKTQGLSGDELKSKLSELKKSGLMTREVFDAYIQLR